MSNILVVAATDRELPEPTASSAASAWSRGGSDRPRPPLRRAVLHVGLAGARGLDVGTLVIGQEAVYCDLSAEWPVVDRVAAGRDARGGRPAALPDAPALPIHTSAAVGGARDDQVEAPLVEAMEGFGVLRAARPVCPQSRCGDLERDRRADRSRWGPRRRLAALERALPAMSAGR